MLFNKLFTQIILFLTCSLQILKITIPEYQLIMQSPKPHSFRVVYDIEKNRYFRVNKLTGQIQLSSKTGKTPPKFDPQITGTDYQARSRFTHFNTMDSQKRNSTKAQQNFQSINHGDISKNMFHAKRSVAFSTKPIQSRLSEKRNLQKASLSRNRNLRNIIQYNQVQEVGQSRKIQKIQTLQTDAITLPKLQKKNSQSRLGSRGESAPIHFKVNPAFINKMRNSQSNADNSFVSYRTKNNPKDQSFVNSIEKLINTPEDNSVSQSRMNWQKFQNNLRKYSQIQQNKLLQNNFKPLGKSQNSQKLQKFAQKSLLSSILDESHFTLDPTNNQMNQSRVKPNERKAVTRTQVQKNIELLARQKASLMILSRKRQARKSLASHYDKNQQRKQSKPLIKAVDLKEIENQEKMKVQMHQQKEAFLYFYPGYAFKENPRLIKEQKDRKINLKKLQMQYLENNEKKFGRIYHSESQNKLT